MPGSTSYQVPHSSTTRPTFLSAPGLFMGPDFISASALSMIAACFVMSSSMRSVFCSVENHWSSSKLVAEPFVAQLPVGSV